MIPTISLTRPPAVQPPGLPRKLLKHIEGNDYLLEIDNSSLSTYTTCPREALYKLVHSRSGQGGYAMTYGKAVHAALECFYLNKDKVAFDTDPRLSLSELTDLCLAKGYAILEAIPPPLTEWRNADTFQKAILTYIKKYSVEDNFSVLGVEQPFAVPLAIYPVNEWIPYPPELLIADFKPADDQLNPTQFHIGNLHVSWTGVIDLVLSDTSTNHWILDHKTSSRNDSGVWKNFELSPQFLGYCWAAQKITNLNFLGAKANLLFGRKPTKTGSDLELVRESFHYKPEHLTEWEENTKGVIANFVHDLTSGSFVMHTNNCVRKYGTCPFHEVCTMVPANRMTMLYSDAFTTNVWNPLD